MCVKKISREISSKIIYIFIYTCGDLWLAPLVDGVSFVNRERKSDSPFDNYTQTTVSLGSREFAEARASGRGREAGAGAESGKTNRERNYKKAG